MERKWEKGRKRGGSCAALDSDDVKWKNAAYSSEGWMQNYPCLSDETKNRCFEDVTINHKYSSEDPEIHSIRFFVGSLAGLPLEDGAKGWGISHFSIRLTKAAGFWGKTYGGFWDGTTLNPNLEWFDRYPLGGGRSETQAVLNRHPAAPNTSYAWNGFYESKWSLPVKFKITSDGNSLLLVNNQILIDKLGETGESELSTVESKTVLLKRKRKVHIVLYYSNREGKGNIILEWKYDLGGYTCFDYTSSLTQGHFFHDPSEEVKAERFATMAAPLPPALV